jgi:NitT/TauT family transport system substrate-binding protein
MNDATHGWDRRRVLRGMTFAATASVLGFPPAPVAAEPPPETTRLRLSQIGVLCIAPQYIAEELLRAEGFTDIQYIRREGHGLGWTNKALAAGETDMTIGYAINFIVQIDAGDPVVLLGGVHAGCYELFGTDRIRAIRDLRGRKVAVPELGTSHHILVSIMAAYVGLDPQKDIEWITQPMADAKRLLAEGQIDALMATPPDVQELRAKKIGHVVVASAIDRPWSQYFCCTIAGNKEFMRKHPVATKRAMRALLKATDICATEPERAARLLVDRGFTQNPGYALQTMKDIPYNRWRDLDPTDAVRFYSLRLHEAGMVKSGPNKILAQGTDWRFFNELKKELKA